MKRDRRLVGLQRLAVVQPRAEALSVRAHSVAQWVDAVATAGRRLRSKPVAALEQAVGA